MHLRYVDCDLRSIETIQSAIRERAAKTSPNEWVLGFKYDDTKTSDGRPLNLADLDAAAPDHPVYIAHRGGHTAYVNSRAFALANVTDDQRQIRRAASLSAMPVRWPDGSANARPRCSTS